MPTISIIVPIYKVEQYLDRCISSIFAQTFQDYELILVDDGSPDNCGKMCDDYALKDKRVKVVHKENGGLADARNAGLDIATGEYILFCDSDDFVHPQWCEIMLSVIENNKDSFIVCDIEKVTDSKISDKVFYNHYSLVEYYYLFQRGLSGYAWNKIYNANILREHNIRFDASIKFAEDVPFNSIYLKYCKNCILVDCKLYYYYTNPDSIMHKYYPEWFGYHLKTFYLRIPYIEPKHLSEYCDGWLYEFINMIDNVHDKRNLMTWKEQMKYNQEMFQSEEFGYCLEHATGNNESPKIMKLLKTRNYYLYYFVTKLKK